MLGNAGVTTIPVSVGEDGEVHDINPDSVRISADGTDAYFVSQDPLTSHGTKAFFDTTDPLVAADNDTTLDAYGRSGGTTTLLSVRPDGTNTIGDVRLLGVTTDGSVAFRPLIS